MTKATVLIVGAGPSGLALALNFRRRGIPFRIIDRHAGPAEASRAMAVHARTLELYEQFGMGDEMAAQGIPIEMAQIWAGGRPVAELSLRRIGEGLSPYPFVLAYPQDDHERLLVGKLAELGVSIEWETELLTLAQDSQGVQVTLRKSAREERDRFEYVCGCDGAHSQVRKELGIGFPGGTYTQLFYVADVKVEGEFRRDLRVCFGREDFGLLFPVRTNGMQRLIGLVPPALVDKEDLSFEDIRAQEEELMSIRVREVDWFSRYRTHHRVAERFRSGRCFLLGDAAHIHSPAGGQGMNTGIGDAMNLGWKLAEVIRGRLHASALESYEIERRAFALRLVATTDQGFQALVGRSLRPQLLRRFLAPRIVGLAWSLPLVRRLIFRIISQIWIHYRESPLSAGLAGQVRGGDRLPWIKGLNYLPLRSFDWQIHVYGEAQPSLRTACATLGLALQVFPWEQTMRHAGFARGAAYLVRPDGYVALALPGQRVRRLRDYAEQIGLKPGSG